MAVSIQKSGSHRDTIKVPATNRVIATIKAIIHPEKGTHNPAHIHIKLPKTNKP